MISDDTFRRLTEAQAQDRVVLSLYLAEPGSFSRLEHRLKVMRPMLADGSTASAANEQEHLDHNLEVVRTYLAEHPHRSGALCLFACWALDLFEVVPLTVPVPDLVRVDSSPFVRPLAELRDEFETCAVVVADNRRARIFLTAAGVAGDDEKRITGNVKNHVRKGGWSQKRYERRRDRQLQQYAREVVEALVRLDQEKPFARVVMVGGKEALREVETNLPNSLKEKLVGTQAMQMGGDEQELHADILHLLEEDERTSDRELWSTIEREVVAGGLGATGFEDVLEAVIAGRVDRAVVDRTIHPEGHRCRKCDHLDLSEAVVCAECGADALYPVGIVNELVELLERTGAEMEFIDPTPSLTAAGGIGALLRF